MIAVLCVVALFFFPAPQGPYSAVNGPVTALHSARAAASLRLSLLEAGFNIVKSFSSSITALALFFWTGIATAGFDPKHWTSGSSSLLRC